MSLLRKVLAEWYPYKYLWGGGQPCADSVTMPAVWHTIRWAGSAGWFCALPAEVMLEADARTFWLPQAGLNTVQLQFACGGGLFSGKSELCKSGRKGSLAFA